MFYGIFAGRPSDGTESIFHSHPDAFRDENGKYSICWINRKGDLLKTEKNTENTEITENNKEKSSTAREVMEYVWLIVIVVGVTLLLETFVIVNAVIPSASMEPTIMTGDHIFGNRLAYKIGDPERYDIIIFRYPDDESQLFIKRVIGLPGDTVEFRDGRVYVNNSEMALPDDFCSVHGQTWLDERRTSLTNPFTVPEGSYFVMGDNRVNSRDSRFWTNPFVKREKILGEAFFRYWPLNEISLIRRYASDTAAGTDQDA